MTMTFNERPAPPAVLSPNAVPDLDPVPDLEHAMAVLHRSVLGVAQSAARTPNRISVRFGCASIEVEWPDPTAPAGVLPAAGPVVAETVASVGEAPSVAGHLLRAPLVGTFYHCPEPGAKPFVQVGDIIEPGQQIGIVEAMKLMNPIVADAAGRVVEVLVGDGRPVEYDEPLLLLEPWEGE